MHKAIIGALAIAVFSCLPAVGNARVFYCTDAVAPPSEGEWAGWVVPGVIIQWDEVDTHPLSLWYLNLHGSQLYSGANVIDEFITAYYREWGPGFSLHYVRRWVLPPGSFTLFSQTRSWYATGNPVDDYENRNCPFGV